MNIEDPVIKVLQYMNENNVNYVTILNTERT